MDAILTPGQRIESLVTEVTERTISYQYCKTWLSPTLTSLTFVTITNTCHRHRHSSLTLITDTRHRHSSSTLIIDTRHWHLSLTL